MSQAPHKQYRVLVIDDEEGVRSLLEGRLKRRGHEVRCVGSGEEALRLAPDFKPHVAISDIRMPRGDGFSVVQGLKIPVLLITGHGDKESAIRAVSLGAFAFFEKPFDLDALEVAVLRGAERLELERERAHLTTELERLCALQARQIQSLDARVDSPMLGSSPPLQRVRELLSKVAQKTDATLLILGESGTGKEVAARELHRLTHSQKTPKQMPFLALNCAAIPSELLESELFGHEKGAFTGALQAREGLCEAVRGGTLFLDEIGDMEPRLQAKLLRLVQERAFRRVGSNKELTFSGRIVAATHRELPILMREGRFREDLYYRLSVVSVTLPPLRERLADLPELSEQFCKRHGLKGLAPARAAEALSYVWPGNVRELHNFIERAAILGDFDQSRLVTAALPSLHTALAPLREAAPVTPLPSRETGSIKERREALLAAMDKRWIEESLQRNNGNVSAAARELGLDRKNLSRRMRELGLSEKKAA